MTDRELQRVLDLLMKLSEESTNSSMRDKIADVRSYVWDLLEPT